MTSFPTYDLSEVSMKQLPVRLIRCTEVQRITPHLARIGFGGDDLADFSYDGPDQQVKLYFPKPGQTVPRLPERGDGDFMRWYEAYNAIPEPERPWMRSFTIRAHHPQRIMIDIDFVLHDDAGPAARWARSAKPGDTLGMVGPSSMFARPVPIGTSIAASDWVLLVGDETALPAIGTLIESLPEGTRAVAYLEVCDAAEEQRFDTRGEVTVHWVYRGEVPAGRSDALVEAVRDAQFPPGSVFAWLAGESGAVRALRRHLVDERGVNKRSIDFSGYWRPKLTQDDAPTEEDLADAQELTAHARELTADAQAGEKTPPSLSIFDGAYRSRTAPWVIGEPQPAIVALERDGWIRGTVLDPGCGTGEHTIHLTRLGYDVRGVDFSEIAIEQARVNAAEHKVGARFEVADALGLGNEPTYDTVVDSALFHVFDPAERARYVRGLHLACRPGALVHVLALSDTGPGYGPQISDTVIREAFGDGWILEDLRSSHYRGVVGSEGELGDLPAWLARVRRI
jgi:NADPH-dependent ferric siderophore reductase/SAM-dependent methyltransferase